MSAGILVCCDKQLTEVRNAIRAEAALNLHDSDDVRMCDKSRSRSSAYVSSAQALYDLGTVGSPAAHTQRLRATVLGGLSCPRQNESCEI